MWTSAVFAIWTAYVNPDATEHSGNSAPQPSSFNKSLRMTHRCCLRWSVHGRSSCMFCAANSILSMYGIRSWVLISTLSCFTETVTNCYITWACVSGPSRAHRGIGLPFTLSDAPVSFPRTKYTANSYHFALLGSLGRFCQWFQYL